MSEPKVGDLRVWHIPQFPMEPFYVPLKNVREALLVIGVLADYDQFQLDNKIKPDYANMSGLEVFDGVDWEEWEDEEGMGISDHIEAEEVW